MNAQTQVPSARGSVLLLSTDVALVAAMDPHFTGFGLDLAVFDTPAQLGRRVQDQGGPGGGRPPSLLVLVDLLAFPHVEAFASLGADARAGHPARPPLVCLGQPENLRQRLASLRVGAAAWLPRVGATVKAVQNSRQQNGPQKASAERWRGKNRVAAGHAG
ncbi:hypothetical protein [Candidatus Thiodictyon syntrophicum]|uniref:Response regulatory domain-containing protein n=1 Tax=Candidatus Thiodictyon syntrophicum TaxID=1166950 RepID=A0A2K8U6I8_9GAMM|nr:hypothetical protein [Candidatus Thiodictyon syntrophicum]AUB80661.1 hypothetical protein THSYN_06660 [Candidatus Thiodictyon syntrophicum]